MMKLMIIYSLLFLLMQLLNLGHSAMADLNSDEKENTLIDEKIYVDEDLATLEKNNGKNTSDIARFSLKHQLGYAFQNPKKVVVNRSSLRLEMKAPFKENYLFVLDGKVKFHFGNDHLAKESEFNSSYYLNSRVREAFFQASYENISFRFGKQIINWGITDESVVDDISPENSEEMYFTDNDDSDIGQIMLQLEYYGNKQDLIVIANLDSQVAKLPPKDSEYFFYLPEYDPNYDVTVKYPDKTEYGLQWKRYLESGEFALILADLNDNCAYYEPTRIQNGKTYLDKKYGRYQFIGITRNINFGNILLKGELSYKFNRIYAKKLLTRNDAWIKKNSFDLALEVEYSAPDHASFFSGVSNRHILDWEKSIDKDHDETTYFLGCSKKFLNKTLKTEYLLTYTQYNGDLVHKLESQYDFTDDLVLKMTLYYFNPDKGYRHLEDKSRLTAELCRYF